MKDGSKEVQEDEESLDLQRYEKMLYDELKLGHEIAIKESAWEKH